MNHLPLPIGMTAADSGPSLTRAQVREIDQRAIDDYGIPGMVLMENAGRSAAEFLVHQKVATPVVICAGKGNNGGDGFVIARWLSLLGFPARVLLFCHPDDLTGDAAANYRVLSRAGLAGRVMGSVAAPDDIRSELAPAGCVVDALLGTGATGALREPCLTAVACINARKGPVLAVDLPSGLDCDTGIPSDPCIEATWTVTFVAAKVGFLNPAAHRWLGTVAVAGIGVPHTLINEVRSSC